jgi:hypothetical protein
LSDWDPTPEQREALQQQAFLEELLKVRSAAQKPSGDPQPPPADRKPGWQRFLESSGGAALITVVVGTMGGAVITNLIQSYLQRQQARQQGIAEYSKGEHDTVKAVFDLLGQSVAAAENLSTLTTEGFNADAFQGDQRDQVLKQRKAIRDEFNTSDEQWRSHRETLTLNLRYYHGNDLAVAASWDHTGGALTGYMDCEQHWYIQNQGSYVKEEIAAKACQTERQAMDSALNGLSDALAKNRLYQWGEPKS